MVIFSCCIFLFFHSFLYNCDCFFFYSFLWLDGISPVLPNSLPLCKNKIYYVFLLFYFLFLFLHDRNGPLSIRTDNSSLCAPLSVSAKGSSLRFECTTYCLQSAQFWQWILRAVWWTLPSTTVFAHKSYDVFICARLALIKQHVMYSVSNLRSSAVSVLLSLAQLTCTLSVPHWKLNLAARVSKLASDSCVLLIYYLPHTYVTCMTHLINKQM